MRSSNAVKKQPKKLAVFTEWQAMPVTFIALAWMDEGFKQEFLSSPTPVLREVFSGCPANISFCVLENTDSLRHLILPYRQPETYTWTEEQVREQLLKEVGSGCGLEYGLPVDVMVKAFFDAKFRRSLQIDPKTILACLGYDTGDYKYFLHENTPNTSHLILPENKWKALDLSYEQLENMLIQDLRSTTLH